MERRSEQLEQEAADARAQLAEAIEELQRRVSDLRHRMSPSNLLSSPISVSVIGAGAAWFLLRRVLGPSRDIAGNSSELLERARKGVGPIAEKAGALARQAIGDGSEGIGAHMPRLQSIVMTGAGVAAAAAVAALLKGSSDASSQLASESPGSGVEPNRTTASPAELPASRLTEPGSGMSASRWAGEAKGR